MSTLPTVRTGLRLRRRTRVLVASRRSERSPSEGAPMQSDQQPSVIHGPQLRDPKMNQMADDVLGRSEEPDAAG
ncbi:hypothetical protein E4U53_000682 [Claviceps sorghi]|nr:hypothetical protein E4U53_000682 [Claviceps sorghi]